MRSRHTTPPKVLPLLPLGVVAIFLGGQVVDIVIGVLVLVGIEDSDARWLDVLLSTAARVAIAVGLGFALKWLIERWIEKYPPRRGPRYSDS